MYRIGDVLELTQDCELGLRAERGVVVEASKIYMTLVFPHRPKDRGDRVIHTGADYRFVKTV